MIRLHFGGEFLPVRSGAQKGGTRCHHNRKRLARALRSGTRASIINLGGVTMIEVRKELSSLIKACEAAAQSHIAYARQSYTEFQRSFHEQRAAEALQRAR